MYPDLSNRYYSDAEGRLHPVTWKDVFLEVGAELTAGISVAYTISLMVIA